MHPSDFGSNRSRIPPVDRNGSVDVSRLSTWYEDLEEYEGNLEEMASATLDQTFQDEMQHVNQWFGYLTDPEKTATLYTLLQHSSQVQIRFFIHLLQEMRKPKPNPMNRNSERASTLMNLNSSRRAPPPQQQQQQQQQQQPNLINNRHSFALGDTEQLNRMFGTMGTDWLGSSSSNNNINSGVTDHHPLQQPQPRTGIRSGGGSNLRPKSVMELGSFDPRATGSAFSHSWLNTNRRQQHQTQSQKLYNENVVIERPRSADISSWQLLPVTTTTNSATSNASSSSSSWKPLESQHDIDFQQHWKNEQQQPQPQQPRFTNSSAMPEGFPPGSGGADDLLLGNNSRRTSMMSNHSATTSTSGAGGGAFTAQHRNNSASSGFGQYLSPPKNFSTTQRSSSAELISDGLLGYGSDHSEPSSQQHANRFKQNNANTPTQFSTNMSKAPTTMSHTPPNMNVAGQTNIENKEEHIDMELLKDVTAWLRSLRLHKYNSSFENMRWQDMIKLDDEALEAKGVAALGARRKMLKVFENVREHCKVNHLDY